MFKLSVAWRNIASSWRTSVLAYSRCSQVFFIFFSNLRHLVYLSFLFFLSETNGIVLQILWTIIRCLSVWQGLFFIRWQRWKVAVESFKKLLLVVSSLKCVGSECVWRLILNTISPIALTAALHTQGPEVCASNITFQFYKKFRDAAITFLLLSHQNLFLSKHCRHFVHVWNTLIYPPPPHPHPVLPSAVM